LAAKVEDSQAIDGTSVEILIAGGGPVGLFLAAELARAGLSPVVVESQPLPEAEGVSAVRGISKRSLDTLALRGNKDQVMAASRATLTEIANRRLNRRPAASGTAAAASGAEKFGDWRLQAAMKGHFGVIPLFDSTDEFSDLAILPVSYGLLVRALCAEATRLGCRVWRGLSVRDLAMQDDHVAVTLSDGSVIFARYVVGADGGRSTVRQKAGFAFDGTDPTMIARGGELVELADPEKLSQGITRTDRGVLLIDLIPGQIQVIEYGGRDAGWSDPTTRENLQASLRRVSGTDVSVTSIDVPIRYSDNARQATLYRQDRVLLAGDAAHVHSPFGAQGLNLGLQDAANLGWKLASVVTGDAPSSLLDTYERERHPVAERVLRNSRAQAALVHPGAHVDALRSVFAEIIEFPDVKRHFIEMVNGVDIQYYFNGDHPLTGKFMPDLALTGQVDVNARSLLDDGRYLLLDLSDSTALWDQFNDLGSQVNVVSASCDDAPELGALLVRPDGYIAWAAQRSQPTKIPDDVLRRWFPRRGSKH
jgi:2-polyprenyl-6-methoxyphenol hydroxylase-like FAD-dependent oxidoreductase